MPGDRPPAAHPLVYVADLAAPELADDDRHHLARVLRLRDGDPLALSDGAGSWRLSEFGPTIVPTAEVVSTPPPSPPITVAFALVKGDRPEWAVQKLTELGADRIVPLETDRSVVRWDGARREKNARRLSKIAREAAMQSRRSRLPEVTAVMTVADLAAEGTPVALADPDAEVGPTLSVPALLIGPEGGWTDDERGKIAHHVSLGQQILRTETAAVAAATLLVALRSGLVQEGGGL